MGGVFAHNMSDHVFLNIVFFSKQEMELVHMSIRIILGGMTHMAEMFDSYQQI